MSALVKAKLNVLENTGQSVVSITPLPDYHNATDDGGLKNIFFVTKPQNGTPKTQWETTTLIPNDTDTMHNQKTDVIRSKLTSKIAELESQGYTVKHAISIIDTPPWILTMMEGFGGRDGLKNMILCYHK